MAGDTTNAGVSSAMAGDAAGRTTRAIRGSNEILWLRPMDRGTPMASSARLRGSTRCRFDGRHSVRGKSLQRRCVFAPGTVRDRLVGRRSARAVLQGRRIHPEMGTELGDPALPLGRNADAKPRLVALARAGGAQNL